MVIQRQDAIRDGTVDIPRDSMGRSFTISRLFPDQQYIMFRVLSKVHEWLYCDDLSLFKPLRCTIVGQAGSGKSVLLNTITAVLRSLFQRNNVVKVGCPTGTAAFNAFGKTLHRLTLQGISGTYLNNSLSEAKHKTLVQRYEHLLCLIIDERSLLTSKLLGTTLQIVSETIFFGAEIDEPCGGLPILILAGDDFQLGGMSEGAFESGRTGGNKMVRKGRELFRECAQTVFQLSTIRRVSDAKQDDKDLLGRIRLGTNVLDADVEKIQSLHLTNIQRTHGADMVNDLARNAVYLFYTNEKRIAHNIRQLATLNTVENPTAIIKATNGNRALGKGVACHFAAGSSLTSLICKGATVSIQGLNFYPSWGLHNGACGTVKEIIFKPGESPNNGNHPLYVVVDFPLYIGSAWDVNEPKVRFTCAVIRGLAMF